MALRSGLGILGTGAVLGLVACSHPQQVKPEPAHTAPAAVQQTTAANTPAAGIASTPETACTNDIGCPDGHLCVNARCVRIHAGLAECAEARIHFDFNATAIHPNEYVPLQRVARCLKADRRMHLRIEGNADERGTVDYNLALGDQRANEVARYLTTLGVSQAQLQTVSYGKEMPVCTDHTEDCWKKNRRAKLEPTQK